MFAGRTGKLMRVAGALADHGAVVDVTSAGAPVPTGPRPDATVVDIAVPVYNEAHVLAASIERLHAHLADAFPFTWRITVVDNASTDGTWAVAGDLAARLPGVRAMHLDQKGRGRALRTAWAQSDAEVVAYMDVDLSTDLKALLPLVALLVSGHSDVAIGSRLAPGSRTVRAPKRELISRSYNRLLRVVFRSGVHDAQCGFKAVRADVARRLLPEIEDQGWFFDTELLLLAERNGLRVSEVPVDWTDDPDSRVRVVSTAWGDLKGVARVARRFWTGRGAVDLGTARRAPVPAGSGGELVTFGLVGALSTVAALAVFLVLRSPIGALAANAVAMVSTAIANTAANRRWTFGHRGPSNRWQEWRRAGGVHLAGLALTTLALLFARAIDGGRLRTELLLLLAAFLLSTALRFVLMPAWAFRNDPDSSEPA